MSEFTTSDEQTIYYEHTPGEDTLVFIHGWLHNHSIWDKEVKHFTKQQKGTVVLDLRGHGNSSTPEELDDYSMQRFATDVHELLTHLGIQQPTLIGHSLGGMIALTYLKKHSVKRLVLIDSTYENPSKHVPLANKIQWTPITEQLIKYIQDKPRIQRALGGIDYEKTPRQIPTWLVGAKHSAPHVILSCMREILRLNEEELLKHIHIPTLLIAGENDKKTPAKITRQMHQQIPNSKLVIIPDAPHDTPRTHPKAIIQALDEFLEETSNPNN